MFYQRMARGGILASPVISSRRFDLISLLSDLKRHWQTPSNWRIFSMEETHREWWVSADCYAD
jgi:hypothetical protein